MTRPIPRIFTTALFAISSLCLAPCQASESPTIHGFSLDQDAAALIERFEPVVLDGQAFIHKRRLEAPLESVEFTYRGGTIHSIVLGLDARAACASAMDSLAGQLGEPVTKRDGDVFVAYWDTPGAGISAQGACGDDPLYFRITMVRRTTPDAGGPAPSS